MALENRMLFAGSGSTVTTLTRQRQNTIGKEIEEIIELLFQVEYEDYLYVMQGIRLAQII